MKFSFHRHSFVSFGAFFVSHTQLSSFHRLPFREVKLLLRNFKITLRVIFRIPGSEFGSIRANSVTRYPVCVYSVMKLTLSALLFCSNFNNNEILNKADFCNVSDTSNTESSNLILTFTNVLVLHLLSPCKLKTYKIPQF